LHMMSELWCGAICGSCLVVCVIEFFAWPRSLLLPDLCLCDGWGKYSCILDYHQGASSMGGNFAVLSLLTFCRATLLSFWNAASIDCVCNLVPSFYFLIKYFLFLEISILLCINVSSCSLVTSYTATRDLKSTFSSIVWIFYLDTFWSLRSTYLMNMSTQQSCSFPHLFYVDNNAGQMVSIYIHVLERFPSPDFSSGKLCRMWLAILRSFPLLKSCGGKRSNEVIWRSLV